MSPRLPSPHQILNSLYFLLQGQCWDASCWKRIIQSLPALWHGTSAFKRPCCLQVDKTTRNILKKKEKDKKDIKIPFNPSLSANETSPLCLPNASQSVAPCSWWKTPRLPKAIADRYNKYSRHERRQLTGEGGGWEVNQETRDWR